MGHAIDYLVVDKRSEIMKVADEFAFYNTDRGENPSGSYHGNLHIHDRPVCESYSEAVGMIEEWDTGWYSDHAVRFKDKSVLKPTKQMQAILDKIEKLRKDREEYEKAHSIKSRTSAFIGCKRCESKISSKYLRGNNCPVCGNELRAEYIIERLKKYDKDIKELKTKYAELQAKQSGKCPTKWLVKVEVHC